MPEINAGDTAFIMIATAMVLLMTAPGLAMFYGGMVRAKSTLNMIMMSFGALVVISLIWVTFGYSVTFGPAIGSGSWSLLGNPSTYWGLSSIMNPDSLAINGGYYPIPAVTFVAFQGVFAVITVALISGAIADRVRFGPWLLFAAIWGTFVYLPVSRAVFYFGDENGEQGGLIGATLGAIDFAGGTAVHINSGVAALALAIVLGKRIGFGKMPMRPSNLPLVMIGAGLLWFGWFGFNAGSALAANGTAAIAFINTITATSAAVLAWLLTEKIRDGHATSLGAASGVVAGLVAITPACASVDTWGAISIGAIAGALCALAVGLKYKFGYDDSLDVVGVHLVGGIVGTILIGFFEAYNGAGIFYGGDASQLIAQIQGVVIVMIYTFVMTVIIGGLLVKFARFRVTKDEELQGVDLALQAESAYDFSDAGSKGVSA
jgi:ammonium transporter, Amt family